MSGRALREHVIGPILAGVRSPRRGRKPATWAPAVARLVPNRLKLAGMCQ